MDLWNAVEKDKVVQAARRAAVARNKTRMDPTQAQAQAPLKKVLHPSHKLAEEHRSSVLWPKWCR